MSLGEADIFQPIEEDWTSGFAFEPVNLSVLVEATGFNETLNETLFLNETGNTTTIVKDQGLSLVTILFTSFILAILIILTVIGNVFVIAAILMERNLQSVGNYLVLSLAVADLMVACLVMPLGAVYEVRQEWSLGAVLCDIWTSCDVLCCTASILHLLAIAVDRYWAVTNVDYIRQRNLNHIGTMIFLVWGVAFLISIAPIVGWKDEEYSRRIQEDFRCLVSQDVAYQIFATCSSFYVPLIIILLLYWRIFQVARKRIRHRPGKGTRVAASVSRPAIKTAAAAMTLGAEMTVITAAGTSSSQQSSEAACVTNGMYQQETPLMAKKEPKKPCRETLESKRERKAAKTLAIITGIFVICWLPFFVVALMMPLCPWCEPSGYLFSIFLWLGYINSMLNPIIYTIFSPDFRSAFKRMFGRRRRGKR